MCLHNISYISKWQMLLDTFFTDWLFTHTYSKIVFFSILTLLCPLRAPVRTTGEIENGDDGWVLYRRYFFAIEHNRARLLSGLLYRIFSSIFLISCVHEPFPEETLLSAIYRRVYMRTSIKLLTVRIESWQRHQLRSGILPPLLL